MLVELIPKIMSCLLHALYLFRVISSKFPNAQFMGLLKKGGL
jgi:hypothetical protein